MWFFFRAPQPRHFGRRYRPNPMRRYQTQLVPGGASDTHRYIPLRSTTTTPRPRLWWQPVSITVPSTYSSVTIVNRQLDTNHDDLTEKMSENETNTEKVSDEDITETPNIFEVTTIIQDADDNDQDQVLGDEIIMQSDENESIDVEQFDS